MSESNLKQSVQTCQNPGTDRANLRQAPGATASQAEQTLRQQEQAIARRYARRTTVPYVAAGLLCFTGWFALFPLTMLDIVPLWFGLVFASAYVVIGFYVAHEILHALNSREGVKYRFWNLLAGQISTVPMIVPFSMLSQMHMLHHKHTNHAEKDPDAIHAAPTFGKAMIQSWLNRQPGDSGTRARWRKLSRELGTSEAARSVAEAKAMMVAAMVFFFAMAWSGHALTIALLWWLPRQIGLTYIHAVLSWLPHHPHGKQGRFANTRVFRSKLGYYLSLGIEYHLIHHLYPHIPSHSLRDAYREMKPLLEARGVDCSAR